MAKPLRMRVEGLSELEKSLSTLTKATGRNVLRRGLMKAAKPLVAGMKARARERTGALRDSITATKKKPRDADAGKVAFGQVMRSTGGDRSAARAALRAARRANPSDFAEVFVGPDQRPQGIMIEFGTAHHSPRPFARPAWDANKHRVLGQVKGAIEADLEKAIKRAERKARKQALRSFRPTSRRR